MPRKNATSERLDHLDQRLARMEEAFRRLSEALPTSFAASWPALRWPFARMVFWSPHGRLPGTGELPVEPWKHLVRRPHPWRRQLYLRGRNLTARQLVGGMRANHLDEEKAAANYGVPVEAIREALAYVEQNRRLLEAEAEIERLMLQREGFLRGPEPVS